MISVGQHIPLAAGVAAPFRLASGLAGAVSITRSRYETDDAELNSYAPMAMEAAREIENLSAEHEPQPLRPRTAEALAGTALNRIVTLIETLVAHPDGFTTTARGLAERLGAATPTSQRLRTTALVSGLATAPNPQQLHPGPLLLKWAAVLGTTLDITTIVQPDIDRLSAETGETIGYVDFDPATATATMTAVAAGTNPLTYGLGAHVTIPLYAGAAGNRSSPTAPRTSSTTNASNPSTRAPSPTPTS